MAAPQIRLALYGNLSEPEMYGMGGSEGNGWYLGVFK